MRTTLILSETSLFNDPINSQEVLPFKGCIIPHVGTKLPAPKPLGAHLNPTQAMTTDMYFVVFLLSRKRARKE
jgi:hypothetical protein